MSEPALIPRRPYLLRAMHEWMTDNQHTPHMVVDASLEGVVVPEKFVDDGKIILNVSHSATDNLVLGNEQISFNARFNGVTHHINVPVAAVLGLYARETGQGVIFSDADWPTPPEPSPPPETGGPSDTKSGTKRPQLKVVK